MTDAKTPPGPDDPDEKHYAELALAEATQAVHLASTGQPGAQRAFLRSWHAVISSYAADAEESKHRSLAWERAETYEGELMEIRKALSMDEGEDHAEVVREIGLYREQLATATEKLAEVRRLLRNTGVDSLAPVPRILGVLNR